MLPSKGNYYADAEPPPANVNPGPQDKPTDKEGDESAAGQSAEIPKAVLGGKEFHPGDEVVLKVTKVLGDSVLVSYASNEEEEPPKEEAPPPQQAAPTPTGGPMSAMMQ